MAKTERILGNLPPTFAAFPRPTALFAIADAVGLVLQDAENSLVEVMKAHWIDHADRGRDEIRDLELLGALFSLPSWPDEGAEQYRQRLKRHVRTLFAGTATVPGVLRVTADTLGLSVDVEGIERPERLVVPAATDAGPCVLGVAWATARGRDASAAVVPGVTGLGGGVNLQLLASSTLRVAIDGATHDVDLLAGAADPARVRLDEIAAAVNAAFGADVATEDGDALLLRSGAVGAGASIAFAELEANAADPLFGIAPRVAHGADARPGAVEGSVDLGAPVDLTERRYLRLAVDGAQTEELELTGADQAAVTLDEIRAQIDAAFGAALTGEGPHLTVASPTAGAASSVAVEPAAGNDAAEILLGPGAHGFRQGADARPARLVGRAPLSAGVDLRAARLLTVQVGAAAPQEIDCTGEDPQQTKLDELVERINTALGGEVTAHDGVFLMLTAPEVGGNSRIEVHPSARDDAAEAVMGMRARTYSGVDPTAARLAGRVAIRPHIDLWRRRHLLLSVDDGAAVLVDIAGAEPDHTSAGEIADAINGALGASVASVADDRLVLTSATSGGGSAVHVIGQDTLPPSPFVSRVPVLGEAATVLFGSVAPQAQGAAGQPARVVGSVDLAAGVDLRDYLFLRIGIDGAAPVDVDCRGDRPRVTSPDEIAARIDAALGVSVATVDAGMLAITSPSSGPGSRVVIGEATAGDAAPVLLGEVGAAAGEPPAGVRLTGTRDLSAGLAVHERSLVCLGVDGMPPVEVDLSSGLPGLPELVDIRLDTAEIARRINDGLGSAVAFSDGVAVTVASPTAGAASALEFAAPSDPSRDATAAVFGIDPQRTYSGTDATRATITGTVVLPATVDLGERRHLRLALDGAAPVDVDCTGADPSATTPDEVVARINGTLGPGIAALTEGRLTLTSPTEGVSSAILVLPATVGDARALILGDVPGTSRGTAASAAMLTGEPALVGPIDLSERSRLRIALDGSAAVDVDVAGSEPSRTFTDEVVAAINEAFPAAGPVASLTVDGHLRLTAEGTVALLPLRYLTLHEFPPRPADPVALTVTQGSEWTVTSRSVAREPLRITLTPDHGVVGPAFLNLTTRARVSVPGPIGPGERLVVAMAAGQPAAHVDGLAVAVEVQPGVSALLLDPGESTWRFTSCDDSRFDTAVFGDAFAGGPCRSAGVFDLSDFGVDPTATAHAVFDGAAASAAAGGYVTFEWQEHQPGRFTMELPADLPTRFGARFAGDQPGCPPGEFAPRFDGSVASTAPEVVFEEPGVAGSIVDWVNGASRLVEAEWTTQAPPGVTPLRAPWRDPVRLEGGGPGTTARLVAFEDGLDAFVDIRARAPGAHGNRIEVTVAAGARPGVYEITIGYAGEAVFELARERVHDALLAARAAGVESTVTRTDRDP